MPQPVIVTIPVSGVLRFMRGTEMLTDEGDR